MMQDRNMISTCKNQREKGGNDGTERLSTDVEGIRFKS